MVQLPKNVRLDKDSEITVRLPQGDFLSSTYQHVNTILWQMPAFGLALFGAVLTGAFSVIGSEEPCPFGVSAKTLELIVLVGGALAMASISRAMYRARQYQAAAFCDHPSVLKRGPYWAGPNVLFQSIMILCTFSLIGLGVSSVVTTDQWPSLPTMILLLAIFVGSSVIVCVEGNYRKFVKDVDKRAS